MSSTRSRTILGISAMPRAYPTSSTTSRCKRTGRLKMRLSRYTPFLLAVLVFVPAWPILAGNPAGRPAAQVSSAAAGPDVSIQLGDRKLDVGALTITPTKIPGVVQASITVTLTNIGTQSFVVRPDDFTLSAEGDMFGQGSAGTLAGTLGPGISLAGKLTFLVPRAALPELALVYHPLGQSLVVSIPLGGATPKPPSGSVPLAEAARGTTPSVLDLLTPTPCALCLLTPTPCV